MTEQTPEPVDSEAPETAVETEKTTNDLSQQDDVEVAADQSPYPQPAETDDGSPDAEQDQ